MNPADTARVLAKCQSYDRRTVGAADIAAWHEALDDIDLPDALNAVAAHYATSTEWIMPAHVRRIVNPKHTPTPPTFRQLVDSGAFDPSPAYLARHTPAIEGGAA